MLYVWKIDPTVCAELWLSIAPKLGNSGGSELTDCCNLGLVHQFVTVRGVMCNQNSEFLLAF